ncbi:MAG TPA: transposase [Tepidisphaeraceae bacterium]|jgi:putative transposase
MPRQARHAPGDVIYHVLNRAAGKMELFRHDGDFAAFQRALVETLERIPIPVCGYCLMPNHWHLVLWPVKTGELSRFMQRLTITHVRRWLEHRHRVGMGSVYQGRYKSFPVQDDGHFTTLMRYVQRNPVRAGLVKRAENWRWSSLSNIPATNVPRVPICPWPVVRRADWVDWVNQPQTPGEEQALRRSLTHSRPFGAESWTAKMELKLGIGPLRPRGRPAKVEKRL